VYEISRHPDAKIAIAKKTCARLILNQIGEVKGNHHYNVWIINLELDISRPSQHIQAFLNSTGSSPRGVTETKVKHQDFRIRLQLQQCHGDEIGATRFQGSVDRKVPPNWVYFSNFVTQSNWRSSARKLSQRYFSLSAVGTFFCSVSMRHATVVTSLVVMTMVSS
jgi:hypothetical protein